MTRQLLKFLLIFTPALLFERCAQQGVLTGGKRDTTPPRLIESLPPQQSVNFNAEEITLKFDEFVKLNDLNGQLIVSPRLKTTPDIEADGKKIKIRFKKEELKPNTTYRIYLGQAVVDMHEANAIPNFEYVFSTGSFVDSLKLSGIVSESFNNKAAGNTIVALYEGSGKNDSLPYQDVPDYLAKSDAAGHFAFSNLPYGNFKAYAYNDRNKNYLYDGESEQIAFLDAQLNLKSDSAVNFKLFQEESPKGFVKKTLSPYYGFVQLVLNKPSRVKLSTLNPRDTANIVETLVNKEKDTVSVYYKNLPDTLGLILKNTSTGKSDTMNIALPKKNQKVKKLRTIELNARNNTLALNAKPTLSFLTWMDIQAADRLKMKLSSKEDSTIENTPVSGRWLDITHFEISNQLKEGAGYRLKIDTNAFFDINGISNDSIVLNFKTQSKLEFGKVSLKILFNQKQGYIVQLIDEKEQMVTEKFVSLSLSASNAVSIDFIDVLPGNYKLKIIFDANENKKWDTGNLFLKRQPERVLINSKQIKILPDWEVEEEFLIKE